MARHITLGRQPGQHRQCGPEICTFHLGFSLVLPVHLLGLAPLLSSVGAVAGDERHTELWFWQSAMGYTDNATVKVTMTGEKRPSSQEER